MGIKEVRGWRDIGVQPLDEYGVFCSDLLGE